ncbi:MAG: hexokinase [Anaerovibrio sp.]|uniref:hexokinase n=1 Tax=Anaerovibrio sp. TaxID=1872532 RepID=UPI0025F40071|nr:hexokinase [Anaerovibrio sp.]MCR5176747.1 hexokinase [Anaerovibrio sp.]
MVELNEVLYNELLVELRVDKDFITEAAGAFRWDLEQGLKGTEFSSLQMLPSYIGLPEGNEKGKYLALDFGGTNVRAAIVELLGAGRYTTVRRVEKPLITDSYNLIDSHATREELFSFLAGIIEEVIDHDSQTEYFLGHTFSFGTEQHGINEARLIRWAKEFAVPGVEGEDVNRLLYAALSARGFGNVRPVAILNDTVAVLLATAYSYPDTCIGSIYATGHNTCYMEKMPDIGRPACILNMESGGFSKLVPTKWDLQLDSLSEKPGRQRLEKMVSGRYMGELFSRLVGELLGLENAPVLSAVDMSLLMADDSSAYQSLKGLPAEMSLEQYENLGALAKALAIRSARLVAATWAGTLWHLASNDKILPQHIAVDGSVYQHMPYVRENVMRALYELLGEEAGGLEPVLVKDGSGVGAAIAAAVACRDI